MENKKIQNYCRFVTVCDFLFVVIFTFVQSFFAGIWFGLEICIFIPVGTWVVTGAFMCLLTLILSTGIVMAVLYGAVVLWKEKTQKNQRIYNCYMIVSIVLTLGIITLGITLNVLGLRNLWINLFIITGSIVLAALNAAGFWLRRERMPSPKKIYQEKPNQIKTYGNEIKEKATVRETGIEAVKGEYAGAVFLMKEDESITFGTQLEYCQILFHDPYISRRHCVVCYKSELHNYEIVDYSKNGTFWMNGDRLPFGEACVCPPGTVFTIDGQSQIFRLI